MIGFFIPLRARETSRDFVRCEQDLEAAVRQVSLASACQHSIFIGTSGAGYSGYGAEVVEVPDAPIPSSRRGVLLDKAVKRYASILTALRRENYTMFAMLDADDLVSRNYVSSIEKLDLSAKGGAVLDRGYVFDSGRVRLQRRFGLNKYCGSTLVLTREFLEAAGLLPEASSTWPLTFENIVSKLDGDSLIDVLGDHIETAKLAASLGLPMDVVKEPLVTWVVNNANNESRTALPFGSLTVGREFSAEFGLEAGLQRRADFLERGCEYLRFAKSWLGSLKESVRKWRAGPCIAKII